MVVHLAHASAEAACDAINHRIDAAVTTPGAGKLRVYSGTRPATADTALSGNTVLIEFVLGNPAFAPAGGANGSPAQAVANAISPVTAAATGTATFFQVVDNDNNVVFDGAVTDTTGSGDLKLSTVSVVTGIDVSVVSLNALMPEGT